MARDDDRRRGWRRGWRHPIVGGLVAVLVVVGTVLAVPDLSVQRSRPVAGEIGVPDVADLQAAPRGTRVRQVPDAPEVSCARDGVAFDCVAWSRWLGTPRGGRADNGTWAVTAGDRLLVVSDDHVEAVDPATGTRLWDLDLPTPAHPVGVVDGAVVLEGQVSTSLVDLDDGRERWSVRTGVKVWGAVAHGDVVYTGHEATASSRGVVARDPRDGTVQWVWPSPWDGASVQPLAGGRLLAMSPSGRGLALLDADDGREIARSPVRNQGVLAVMPEVVVMLSMRGGLDPSGPNPAGDPGATLTAVDLRDLTPRWERDVPASSVGFGAAAGLVVAPSTDLLTAIEATTGEVAWSVPTEGTEDVAYHGSLDPFSGLGSVSGGAPVVVTTSRADGAVRGRAPRTGEVVWEHMTTRGAFHAVAAGDVAMVYGADGYRALDLATGRERLRVTAVGASIVDTSPLLLHHSGSGYVTRLTVDGSAEP